MIKKTTMTKEERRTSMTLKDMKRTKKTIKKQIKKKKKRKKKS